MVKAYLRFDDEGYVDTFAFTDIGDCVEYYISEEVSSDMLSWFMSYKDVNGEIVKDLEKNKQDRRFMRQMEIREQREIECFPIINRGGIWYELLTSQEKTELMEWYQAWLNATETLEIPIKPEWLN